MSAKYFIDSAPKLNDRMCLLSAVIMKFTALYRAELISDNGPYIFGVEAFVSGCSDFCLQLSQRKPPPL